MFANPPTSSLPQAFLSPSLFPLPLPLFIEFESGVSLSCAKKRTLYGGISLDGKEMPVGLEH